MQALVCRGGIIKKHACEGKHILIGEGEGYEAGKRIRVECGASVLVHLPCGRSVLVLIISSIFSDKRVFISNK